MLDLKNLRKDPQGLEVKLKNKVPEVSLSPVIALDEQLRSLKTEVEELKSKKTMSPKKSAKKSKKAKMSLRLCLR